MEKVQETAFPFSIWQDILCIGSELRFKSSRNIQNAVFYFVILFNIILFRDKNN